jgi:hypothetical protein
MKTNKALYNAAGTPSLQLTGFRGTYHGRIPVCWYYEYCGKIVTDIKGFLEQEISARPVSIRVATLA